MYYPSCENKGADQLRGYREADLRLCFRICRLLVFSRDGSYIKRWLENESKQMMNFMISQNIHADLEGPKGNVMCTMDDIHGDFLGPLHGTTPAAVKANKNKVEIL